MSLESRTFLRSLFDAAVAAADPMLLLPGRLPSPPAGRTVVIGAGKAAARMARAVEQEWSGPLDGLVVTRYGHGEPCARIRVVEAAHPLPDAAGREATAHILRLVQDLTPDDLVICLLSGGGSALLEAPPPGITLEDLQAVGRALLRSGAGIGAINCVRKHLSLVKGGRLAAAAHPARVVTYVISDVPGDDPSVIASGPTVPDPTTFAEALAVLGRYAIAEPAAVLRHLQAGAEGGSEAGLQTGVVAETPKPGDPSFFRDEVVVLATAYAAIDAAARVARAVGVAPVVLGYDLEAEARELGREHAALALACAIGQGLAVAPCVLLSGGETTVTVTGRGRGGRNTEYLLGLALGLQGAPGICAVAADTDGIDGTEDNAGAFLMPETLDLARAAGCDAAAAQAANDAYGFFAAAGALLVTGPTRTNVNDLRAVLVQAAAVE
jgi:hydroxypyruvate reductase